MREKSIYGNCIKNVIGFCHYDGHKGALNATIARKRKCIAKNCKYLEKYDEASWNVKQASMKRRKRHDD